MIPEILMDEKVYDYLSWEDVDGLKLDKLIEGMTVIGSEPIDYPLTDGIDIYLRSKDGAIYALEIGYYDDFVRDAETENLFYVKMAKVEQKS